MAVVIRTESEIAAIAAAGDLAAAALQATKDAAKPGVSCLELSEIADSVIRDAGAVPTFIGYHGFPAAVCACPNSVVAHGIPDGYRLEDGDLIGIDVAATLDGWIADTAATFPVGEITRTASALLASTLRALENGIAAVRPGATVGDISRAIEAVGWESGFYPVRELAGHAVGRELHEGDLVIPNYDAGDRETLVEGMVFAIEPMFNVTSSDVLVDDDGWTIVSADGHVSACFEHTVAVTADGCRVLTAGRSGN